MMLKKNLDYFLKKSGISASKLAVKISVPKTTVNNWTAGVAPRDLNQLKKLADFMQTTIDALVFTDLSVSNTSRNESINNPFAFEGDFRIRIERISKK